MGAFWQSWGSKSAKKHSKNTLWGTPSQVPRNTQKALRGAISSPGCWALLYMAAGIAKEVFVFEFAMLVLISKLTSNGKDAGTPGWLDDENEEEIKQEARLVLYWIQRGFKALFHRKTENPFRHLPWRFRSDLEPIFGL